MKALENYSGDEELQETGLQIFCHLLESGKGIASLGLSAIVRNIYFFFILKKTFKHLLKYFDNVTGLHQWCFFNVTTQR